MKQSNLALIISVVSLGLAGIAFFRAQVQNISTPMNASFPEVFIGVDVNTFDLPDSMYFLGEVVPLHDPDVRERLDREIHVNSFFHSSTIFLLKRANRWLPQIQEVLKTYGVPSDLQYLAIIESGLQNVISPSNAVGFWQFLKPTAREFDLEVNREVDERYDPIKSTHAAVRYLQKAKERFGNWTDAAASYNIGMNGLAKALESQKVDSYYDLDTNDETARYIFRAIALKLILSEPEKYGYNIPEKHLYDIEQTREIRITETLDDLAQWSKEQGINYKLLVRYNPWIRRNKLTVSGQESYTIKLPENING